MKADSTMNIPSKMLALGVCSVLASSIAMAQPSQAAAFSSHPIQKLSSAHAVLAVVTQNHAPIYADDDGSGHAIGVCPKGWYLTVTGATPRDYRVLAPHNRRVYVAKASIKLLGYTVPVRHTRR